MKRELYYPSPGPGVAQWLHVAYVGPGLTRAEILTTSAESDAYFNWQRRQSEDNGRTWTAPEEIAGIVEDTPAGGSVTFPSHPVTDTGSGRSYRFFMRRQWPGAPCYTYDWKGSRHPLVDHVFVAEDGGPAALLRYEDGADFDTDSPFDPAFLNANIAYLGNAPAFGPDGAVFFPVSCSRPGQIIGQGGVCLFRRDPRDGGWRASNVVPIAPELSSRGLLEPEVAVLRDGRILLVCRGSNTAATPGRKWRLLSTDGGKTLGPVEAFGYDDGAGFYSPSSIHRFLRSRRSGRLYWLANIVPELPRGNSPRYPLVIAEIDEERAAVRRESVTVLDTRRPGEPEALQLSNFSVLEDRATGDFEIYVTLLGLNPTDFWRADVYRYRFSPPGEGRKELTAEDAEGR